MPMGAEPRGLHQPDHHLLRQHARWVPGEPACRFSLLFRIICQPWGIERFPMRVSTLTIASVLAPSTAQGGECRAGTMSPVSTTGDELLVGMVYRQPRARRLALALICAVTFQADPVTARDLPEPNPINIIKACFDKALQRKSEISSCQDSYNSACLKYIASRGGNPSVRATRICASEETAAWLFLWSRTLEEALWARDDKNDVLRNFREFQINTSRKCLSNSKNDYDADMMEVSLCLNRSYADFLIKEQNYVFRR